MSDVVERIDTLLAGRNENRNHLQKLGIMHQTISQWSIKDRYPRADDLHKIAEYLNVSMEYLLTGKIEKYTLEERDIIAKFRALTFDQKTLLLNQLEIMYSQTMAAQKSNLG